MVIRSVHFQETNLLVVPDVRNKRTLWKRDPVLICLTDLERAVLLTPRLITRSSILKPIFGKKLLQLWDFALQQKGFLHVIPIATLTGYNLA